MRATRVQADALPERNSLPTLSTDRITPRRLPFRTGAPPKDRRCPAGTPPDAFEFLGAVATARCWMYPCPCCCEGWVALLPDGTPYGYRIEAEPGCSDGCGGPDVAWWQLWRLMCLPPHELPAASGRATAYARAVIRRQLADIPSRPTEDVLRRAAYQLGRWLEAGGLSADLVAPALLAAAERGGMERARIAPALSAAVTAGRAQPARAPQ